MKKQILLFCLLIIVSNAFSQSVETAYGVVIPKGFTHQLDVEYSREGDWVGKMDIYLPPATGRPTPVIINIHGGGWNHGSKEQQKGFSSFFKNGCAVANIGYRLVDVAPAPAAIEDVRSALIYLVKNAGRLNIDPAKIVFHGGSAGGHLALMGAYLGNNHRFDKDYEGVGEFKIAAVLNKYGIADMLDFSIGNKPYRSAVRWIGRHIEDKAFIASVSPLTYVSAHTPPTYIVHGDADPIVPYKQSVWLYEALRQAGVKTKFTTVRGGGHGKFGKEKNAEISKEMIAFLQEVGVL